MVTNVIGISVLVLTALQALHLYEEVRTGFRQQFPFGEIPNPIFVAANLMGFAFALVTAYLCFGGAEFGNVAAWIYAILMLSNGLVHLVMIVIRHRYFPGGVTACLLIPGAIHLVWRLSLQ